jgi:hypothetical protein
MSYDLNLLFLFLEKLIPLTEIALFCPKISRGISIDDSWSARPLRSPDIQTTPILFSPQRRHHPAVLLQRIGDRLHLIQ